MGTLKIVSNSNQPFLDRSQAGRILARELNHLGDQKVVVLGIPRGGIIPARELARGLNGELDVILAHKLRTPGNPEVAMGAVAEGGVTFIDPEIIRLLGISVAQIEEEKAIQLAEISRRAAEIRMIRPRVPLQKRTVILTDDGIATGATTLTAIRAVRFENPSKVILALPVGPEEALRTLADEADETICLRLPETFRAVGQFYQDFSQVSDREMLQTLRGIQKERTKPVSCLEGLLFQRKRSIEAYENQFTQTDRENHPGLKTNPGGGPGPETRVLHFAHRPPGGLSQPDVGLSPIPDRAEGGCKDPLKTYCARAIEILPSGYSPLPDS